MYKTLGNIYLDNIPTHKSLILAETKKYKNYIKETYYTNKANRLIREGPTPSKYEWQKEGHCAIFGEYRDILCFIFRLPETAVLMGMAGFPYEVSQLTVYLNTKQGQIIEDRRLDMFIKDYVKDVPKSWVGFSCNNPLYDYIPGAANNTVPVSQYKNVSYVIKRLHRLIDSILN